MVVYYTGIVQLRRAYAQAVVDIGRGQKEFIILKKSSGDWRRYIQKSTSIVTPLTQFSLFAARFSVFISSVQNGVTFGINLIPKSKN